MGGSWAQTVDTPALHLARGPGGPKSGSGDKGTGLDIMGQAGRSPRPVAWTEPRCLSEPALLSQAAEFTATSWAPQGESAGWTWEGGRRCGWTDGLRQGSYVTDCDIIRPQEPWVGIIPALWVHLVPLFFHSGPHSGPGRAGSGGRHRPKPAPSSLQGPVTCCLGEIQAWLGPEG